MALAGPEPNGPLVAIQFADPAYPPPPRQTIAQASDIWLLNTLTGTLSHLPGFPILNYLMASGIAWTRTDRLVVVAEGDRRTAIAVWRPGNARCRLAPCRRFTGTRSWWRSSADRSQPGRHVNQAPRWPGLI